MTIVAGATLASGSAQVPHGPRPQWVLGSRVMRAATGIAPVQVAAAAARVLITGRTARFGVVGESTAFLVTEGNGRAGVLSLHGEILLELDGKNMLVLPPAPALPQSQSGTPVTEETIR